MHQLHSLSTAVLGVVLATVCAGPAEVAADPIKGEHVFAKWASCHSTDQTARAGPSLPGVLRRKAGSTQGYHCSRAMEELRTGMRREHFGYLSHCAAKSCARYEDAVSRAAESSGNELICSAS
jgi:cytochrome c2